MAGLLDGPAGDRSSLGYYLWLSDKIPWPWPDLTAVQSKRAGPGEAAKSRAAVTHYLSQGDIKSALEELASGQDILLPKKPENLTPETVRWILLAAEGGHYRLAVRLLSLVKTAPQDPSYHTWSHPAVYGREILAAFRLYGLPPELILSVIRTESAFEEEAVSVSNARGLMQLLPSTAKSIAAILGDPEPRDEELFDPRLNIRYGTWYLNELWTSFGSFPLALAAYNGGPFNIKSYLEKRRGLPLDVFLETLPFPETIRYVQSVLENQFIYDAAYLGLKSYPNLTNPVGPLLKEPPPF
jgi:hypothetical protein